ncbi:hypothetical protein LZ30DRAFT_733296 [Colletotrichum cereale]|nr:hypothetical protein LZ30DRAFT_733296 [Colletotrichum cereale]
MYFSKLTLSAITALLIPNLGVYAQVTKGCSQFTVGVQGSPQPPNICTGGQTYCGNVPGGGLQWYCCPPSIRC